MTTKEKSHYKGDLVDGVVLYPYTKEQIDEMFDIILNNQRIMEVTENGEIHFPASEALEEYRNSLT